MDLAHEDGEISDTEWTDVFEGEEPPDQMASSVNLADDSYYDGINRRLRTGADRTDESDSEEDIVKSIPQYDGAGDDDSTDDLGKTRTTKVLPYSLIPSDCMLTILYTRSAACDAMGLYLSRPRCR